MPYDLTRPNTGRVFDYWLGGTHHFEIDRQFGDQVAKQLPVVQEQTRAERAKIKGLVEFFYQHGIRSIVDFGSSLPTCANTHLVAHAIDPQIRVVYSDIDPVTAAYGKELLQGEPNAIYLHGNAATPLAVLDAPETRALLGNERLVGVNFLTLAHLIPDDRLRASWRAIYDWVAPGSYMAVSTPTDLWNTEPYLVRVVESYRRSGVVSDFRPPARLAELVPPWTLLEPGVGDGIRIDIPDGETTKNVAITYSMMLNKT